MGPAPRPGSDLLRYQPVLLADDGDSYLDGVTVHGVEAGPWLQYWIAWPGDRDHEGIDWEMAMVLRGPGSPIEAAYARHRTATRRPWPKVPKEGDRPIVYAGRDKHASYFRRGWHRHGLHLERANGKAPLDLPLQLGVPEAVRRRLAHRDPDAWLAGLGV
jgi:hypothetical protein